MLNDSQLDSLRKAKVNLMNAIWDLHRAMTHLDDQARKDDLQSIQNGTNSQHNACLRLIELIKQEPLKADRPA